MRIDSYISELLFSNDCVIIPGLGGFVANSRGAFLNPAQHTFAPPAKRIAFNASLRVGDGLLASHLTRALNVNYNESQVIIQKFVEEIILDLQRGNNVVISKVGNLTFDKEKNIQFEPDQQVNYLTSSFGLSLVHSPSIRRDLNNKQPVLRKVSREKAKRQGMQTWRLLELVPAAAVLALLFFNPKVVNDLNTGLANINPFNGLTHYRAYEPLQPRKPLTYTHTVRSQDEVLATPDAPTTTHSVTPADTTSVAAITTDEIPVKLNAGYFVVGGCFREYDNAVKFRQQAEADGFKAEITGKNASGLNVVSLYSGSDYKQALHELSVIREKYVQSAWLMKK